MPLRRGPLPFQRFFVPLSARIFEQCLCSCSLMFSRCSRDSEATAYLSAKFDFFRLFLRALLKSLTNAFKPSMHFYTQFYTQRLGQALTRYLLYYLFDLLIN